MKIPTCLIGDCHCSDRADRKVSSSRQLLLRHSSLLRENTFDHNTLFQMFMIWVFGLLLAENDQDLGFMTIFCLKMIQILVFFAIHLWLGCKMIKVYFLHLTCDLGDCPTRWNLYCTTQITKKYCTDMCVLPVTWVMEVIPDERDGWWDPRRGT